MSHPDSDRAFAKPLVGDRWHEMFSWWLYVVDVSPLGAITVDEFGAHPSHYHAHKRGETGQPQALKQTIHRNLWEFHVAVKYLVFCNNWICEREDYGDR